MERSAQPQTPCPEPPSAEALFDRLDPLIRNVVGWSKWGFAPEVQDDVAQQVRLELFRSPAPLRDKTSLESFVKRVCINRCIDEMRRQIRRKATFVTLDGDGSEDGPAAFDPPAPEASDPMRCILLAERATALQNLLTALGDPCQSAIRLFYAEALSYTQIAERLGLSINTVGARLSKCLDKLRGMIGKNALWREEFAASLD